MKQGEHYTGVTVVFFCHDGAGKFLMAKRSQNARDEHGKWDIGAGALDFGQSVERTLRDEVKQEYCADVLESKFLGYRDVHRVFGDKKTHWVGLDFAVRVDPAQVQIGEPHKFDEIGWFTIEALPENLHSQQHVFFDLYKDKVADLWR